MMLWSAGETVDALVNAVLVRPSLRNANTVAHLMVLLGPAYKKHFYAQLTAQVDSANRFLYEPAPGLDRLGPTAAARDQRRARVLCGILQALLQHSEVDILCLPNLMQVGGGGARSLSASGELAAHARTIPSPL